MRKYLFLFIFIFIQPLVSANMEVKTPLSYLRAMTESHKKSNYELLYILQPQNSGVESFRLRHSFANNKEYAQLLRLDNNREEIILKGNRVSYLGDFRPFSLESSHIVDNLPNTLYVDYEKLSGYSFKDAGQDRIADRITNIIRVIPDDYSRYAYALWIDSETDLLLKSQVLAQDNTVLEEFRVLQLYQSEELEMLAPAIESLVLPSFSSMNVGKAVSSYRWNVGWLPFGFKLIKNQTMDGQYYFVGSENIDNRLYSDGLSHINIYVMPSQGVDFNEYSWQQGKLTILNQTINDKDIVIIGDIPLETIKEILKNLYFEEEAAQ